MSISTRFRRAAITIATVALCAAAALGADAAASPLAASPVAATAASGFDTFANVPYVRGGTSQQILDLYVPRHITRPVPLIVYVHGGGWSGGDKSELQGNSGWQTYLSDGFALASIDYTLSGTAVFPQAIYDVNAAIRF